MLVCALIKMAELYCELVNLKTLLWKKIVGVVATVGAVALIISRENSFFCTHAAYGPVTLGRDRVTKELFITLITRNISNFVRSKVEVPSIIN